MTHAGDPFPQPYDDPFAPQDAGPPTTYGAPPSDAPGWRAGPPQNGYGRGNDFPDRRLNTYAVLSPIFGFLVPPAGIAFGHLALPQIKRTGQRGWLAAVCGLVIGYLMCLVLIAVIWVGSTVDDETGPAAAPTSEAPVTAPPPRVVTSMAPAPVRPRSKLDLNRAAVGQCVEIQQRDSSGDDALDLFEVPCTHRVGVYTVVARVAAESDCTSTYIAAPPDRAFAICLNRY